MRSERLVEMGSDRVEYEDLAAHERDFLAHIRSSCPEVAVDVVWVSEPVVDRDQTDETAEAHEPDADRDYLRLTRATDRQAAAAARAGRVLFGLGDLAAGAAVASLVSIAISLTRHPIAFPPVLIAISVGSFLGAVVLVATGRLMVLLSSYVELRTRDLQRRSLE